MSDIDIIIICEIRIGGRDGLIIKIAQNKFFWKTFGVKIVVSFNEILSNVKRVPMWPPEAFTCY